LECPVLTAGHSFCRARKRYVHHSFIIFVDRIFTSFVERAFTSIFDAQRKSPRLLACITGATPINSPAT
jgi:hypothetical protein